MTIEATSKIALITGASSGIGRAYARHLASQGYNLVLVSKDISRLDRISQELNRSILLQLPVDLSKREGVELLLTKIPTPEIVVANAGITMSAQVGQTNQKARDSLYYLLCGGVIDLLETLVPKMKIGNGGRIVIISRIGALTPMRKSSLYASAKAAIARYGDSLAQELKDTKINLTVALPGYVRTNAHNRAGLSHLNAQVPNWMWLTAEQTVAETEQASLKGKTVVIPGTVYRCVRPFLGSSLANTVWRILTARRKPIRGSKNIK
jgi:short-subunit dehydrogenase